MDISAFAAPEAGAALEPFSYTPDELGPFDLEVAITHCGVCHSDIHLIDNDWQISAYPLIPGHEIIGMVTEVGSVVSGVEVGQRVGIGWQRGSCLECEWCVSGDEVNCPAAEATCVGHHGGFARRIRIDSRFVHLIPDALSSENAAPLLCAGITVYTPIRRYLTPPMRVGVIGIGGLGHLALQFARAYGCKVTAFSSTDDKENEAKQFGAHDFVASKNSGALEKAARSQDLIICTAMADLDWKAYLDALRPHGHLCFVGAPPGPVGVHGLQLIFGEKSVTGSAIGTRTVMREMLDFAVRHDITTQTEVMPMEQVNEAVARVRKSEARYRVVLTV